MTRKSDSFIVTRKEDSWDIINEDILEKYAIKDQTKQLEEEYFLNNENILPPLYNPHELNKLLELNVWHERCVDAIARDSAGQGYTLKPKSGVETPNMDEKKLIEEFLAGIRPSITELLYKKMYDVRANGNGAWEIIRTNGRNSEIKDIKHIPSHTLRRLKDGVRVIQQIGTNKVYFVMMDKNKDDKGNYYDVDYKTGEKSNHIKEEKRANELIWSKIYTPRSKYYGNSKIIPAIRTIYSDVHRSNYNTSFFKNYGMPAFAVIVTGDFDPGKQPGDEGYDIKETLKYKLQEQLEEIIRNPHSVLTIMIPSEDNIDNSSKVDIKIEPLSVDIKEASFRLFRKDNRDEIIAAHGVDPNRLSINESGQLNGSNSKELDNSYKTSLINPLKRINEDEINYFVFKTGLNIQDWVFNIIDNDPRNLEKDVNIVSILTDKGIITPNEARDYLGESLQIERKNDPELDKFYHNGILLANYSNEIDPDMVLKDLEDELLNVYDEKETNEDENEGIKKAIKNLTTH